jgi:hypothetical protein
LLAKIVPQVRQNIKFKKSELTLILNLERSAPSRHSRSNSRESSLQNDAQPVKPAATHAAKLGPDELENKAKLLLEEYLSSENAKVKIL